MPVKIMRKRDLIGTDRHLKNEFYETVRFLLASDGTGVTVTDIVLQPNAEAVYGYDSHIEIAYCIEGKAILKDLVTEAEHVIEPGTMWIASRGQRFGFRAEQPTRLICVFNPAFGGHETGFAGDQ